MPKKKLKRFAENATFANLIQPGYHDIQHGFPLKGKWSAEHFKNTSPICLEVGCGKGEYTIGLSRKYKNTNFIGLDIKGARLWRGAKTALEDKLDNVAFLRTQIELIEHCFARGEVSEIWISFPDPQPKDYKARKRLTSPEFLKRYKNILKENHLIHLKTDNRPLYEFTMDVIKEEGHELIYDTKDLYKSGFEGDVMGIRTYYEEKWLDQGLKINYIQFRIKG